MKLVMRVRFVAENDPKRVLPGIRAALYDRDWQSPDDYLDAGVADAKGEIFFTFEEKKYQDAEDQPAWKLDSLPDLYVQIHDAQGNVLHTTRDQTVRDKLPALLTVAVPQTVIDALAPPDSSAA
jgi:hypothetical protein